MRVIPFLIAFSLASFPIRAAVAQVTDAERASARDLFKQGDQLQRAGHFAEALDKFQRAQQVFSAPTNLLRIAECEAALGRLVEAAEAYREVLRTPLAPGAPPAFQAALDQAKGELAQVEPRVPKLVVEVQPAVVQGAQMQIDGQNVPGALIGEPMPLDAGVHKVIVFAPGYSSSEEQVELKERETKTASFSLTPAPRAAPAAPPAATARTAQPAGYSPPPPPGVGVDLAPPPPHPTMSVLLGLHIGVEAAGSNLPTANPADGYVGAGEVSSSGPGFGFDGGLRFARHWYIGLTFDYASLGHGSATNLTDAKRASSTTALATVNLGFISAPDRIGFWGEIGLGTRWFTVNETHASDNTPYSDQFVAPQFTLGAGLWIAATRSLRVVPKVVLGFGSFDDNQSGNTTDTRSGRVTTFGMLGVAGFYDIPL